MRNMVKSYELELELVTKELPEKEKVSKNIISWTFKNSKFLFFYSWNNKVKLDDFFFDVTAYILNIPLSLSRKNFGVTQVRLYCPLAQAGRYPGR